MPLQRHGSWLVSLLLCAAGTLACADDDAGRFGPDGTALAENRVEVSPLQLSTHEVTLSVNEAVTLTAAYERPDASGSSDVTDDVAWFSANPSIAWVHEGTIVGVSPGSTEINARYAAASDSLTVTVNTSGLRKIELQPETVEIAKGTTATLRAIGTFSQGTARDITDLVSWQSPDTAIAELEGNIVYGRDRGTVAIQATLADVSATLAVLVTDARLLELVAVRQREQMEVGSTQQLRARGRFSDAEIVDVTDLAAWTSDDGNLASVDENGLVRARETGEVGIWARYLGLAAQTSVAITLPGQADPE